MLCKMAMHASVSYSHTTSLPYVHTYPANHPLYQPLLYTLPHLHSYHIHSLPSLLPLPTLHIHIRIRKHRLLRTPKLAIQPIPIDQFLMRARLCDIALSQDDDNVRVVNGAQAMRYEYRGAFLLLDEGVDVR
jgi:hypothetical protein